MSDEPARSNKIPGQLQIEVPASPGAIGRWDVEHQFSAYRKEMGEDKANHQRRLAEEAEVCTCGVQDKEKAKASEEGRREKRVLGNLHHPGCPAFRALSKKTVAISEAEQAKRFEESKVDNLRGALDKAREEGRL